MNTQYRVSVGAYGWAGEGRPSMPRDVGTAAQGRIQCSEPHLHVNDNLYNAKNKTGMLISSTEIDMYM